MVVPLMLGDRETQTIHTVFVRAPLIVVYCETLMKHTNRLCGQTADIVYH